MTSAKPLLFRTALNLAANRRRSRRLWGWFGLDKASDERDRRPSPEAGADQAQVHGRIRAAIDGLPEHLKRVVLLCELAEMSYQEVSVALGIPAGTVGSRRNKALALLEEALGPIEGVLR